MLPKWTGCSGAVGIVGKLLLGKGHLVVILSYSRHFNIMLWLAEKTDVKQQCQGNIKVDVGTRCHQTSNMQTGDHLSGIIITDLVFRGQQY